MSEPKIWTKNYVSGDCTITVSHSDASKGYLYDRDKDAKWLTSGANSDATVASIEVVFKEGSTAVDRTIDKLLIVNHNLKNWDFYSWNGSSWVLQANENTDAATTTYKSFSPVTTSKVKLECDATQIADAEKFIGQLIVAALQMDVGHDFKTYDVRYRERSREIELGDGSKHKMITRWTTYRTQKYEARCAFEFVTEAERLTLKSICESRAPFLFYPESTQRPDEIFLVRWSDPWAEGYVSSYKGAGLLIPMNVKEV